MKRFRNTRSWEYSSLMLFREELEEIVRMFNPSGDPDAITISDSEAEYDSLDEMQAQKGDRIKDIKIASHKPSIVINLRVRPKTMYLSTLENTDEADVAFFKTNELLQPKRRPLNTLVTNYFALFFALAMVGLTPLVADRFEITKKVPWSLWVGYPIILLIGFFCGKRLDDRTALFVSLARRRDSPSFVKRKKDDLIVLVIGTILGALITLLLQEVLRTK